MKRITLNLDGLTYEPLRLLVFGRRNSLSLVALTPSRSPRERR